MQNDEISERRVSNCYCNLILDFILLKNKLIFNNHDTGLFNLFLSNNKN